MNLMSGTSAPALPPSAAGASSRSTSSRRQFLKRSLGAGLALSLPRRSFSADSPPASRSPNERIRVAVIGLGDTTAVGGVGGRGHQLIPRIREVPNVQITALCDVDRAFLEREAQPFRDRGETVATHVDLRRVLDDPTIDVVVVALPNHWHALATVWACQAGKDVYVEKPLAHTIWEGRQMVAAARQHGRMVQVGTQNRSSPLLRQVFTDLQRGELGAIRLARALVYRARDGLGTVNAPTPVPATVDYDLWCGPVPTAPLMRRQLHYEWHWFWATGNGEIGNNGPHAIDLCRWALGQDQAPPHVLSVGGRFAFNDCGETANTHLTFLGYQPAPILCEIRNVRAAAGPDAMGRYRGRSGGVIIDCEGGYFAGDASGAGSLIRKAGRCAPFPMTAVRRRWRPPTSRTSLRPCAAGSGANWWRRPWRDTSRSLAVIWPTSPIGSAERPHPRRSANASGTMRRSATRSIAVNGTCATTAWTSKPPLPPWVPG
ncbi:MAG: Gfo/Idh/MocA family oxidoreductase [Verrucomicrobia bacterium]|nr:Gfo/Idh/MocA family oxidoreductase [Verrucomicrobiota bacterium]